MNKKLFAEMIGTFALVLFGCGSAIFNAGGVASAAWVLTVAITFGVAVVTMAYAIGGISGCHINPAITLGVWLSGRMKTGEALGYMMAQVIGALLASSLLYSIVQMGVTTGGVTLTGANGFAVGCAGSALLVETIFTALFVFVVLATTAPSNGAPKFAGLAIGLTLVIVHIVCIPITGTSVNPARSIAPAIFAGTEALSQLWVFIVGPFLGGAIAAGLWKAVEPAKV